MRRRVQVIYGLAILVGGVALSKFWIDAQREARNERFDAMLADAGIMTPPGDYNPLVSVRDLMTFIAEWEGFRGRPYRDSVGVWTVGYGTNIEAAADTLQTYFHTTPEDVIRGRRVLSVDDLDHLFLLDVVKARDSALKLHPTLSSHPHDIQLIVIDMVYNLGPTGFEQFVKARQALDARDYLLFAEEIKNSKWYGQTGRRSKHHYETARSQP